jgi:uncharacterized protein YbjQ (UPF0145 family)
MSVKEPVYLPMATLAGGGVYSVNGKLCVCEPLGMVFSHRTQGINWFRDVIARMHDFLGGAVKSYDKPVYKNLIIPCLRDLSDQAHDLYDTPEEGPDVVIGVSYEVTHISGKGMSMMAVSARGTAARWVALPALSTPTMQPAAVQTLEQLVG